MYTTLFLVRNADTDFSRDGRVAGRRDISLSAAGRKQAEDLRDRLSGKHDLVEILASPLPRAVETAELLAGALGLGVVRDPRLIDFDAGRWEGQKHAEIGATSEYQKFIGNPVDESIPGGERIDAVPLRVLLAHYLGMNLIHYHRLRLSPASLSILRFESEAGVPRILTINCTAEPGPALR
jgi:probable phosphoglycerate mutase